MMDNFSSFGRNSNQCYRLPHKNFTRPAGSGRPPSGAQHQLYNTVFGSHSSAVLPHSLFGRGIGVGTSIFANPTTPPNHFNFPLRSNAINGVGLSNRGFPAAGNNMAGGKSRGNVPNQSLNYNRNGRGSNGSGGDSLEDLQLQPQYRIYKRGDNIPGLSAPGPTAIIHGSSSSDQEDKGDGDKSGLGISGQNKENSDEKGNNNQKGLKQVVKTPVGQVTDLARFHGLEPEYHLVSQKGAPHNPTFTVSLHLGQNEYVAQGSSIKKAQHAAATEALEKTELARPTSRCNPKRNFGAGAKQRPNWALMQLTTLAEELKEPVSIVQQPMRMTMLDPFRREEAPSVVSVHVGNRIFTGEGSSFNSAKNLASMIALKAMMQVKQELDLKRLAEGGGVDGNSQNIENKSPISAVHEMAMKRSLNVTFEVTKEEGPPHSKVFTVVCSLVGGEDNLVAEGQGATKQAAKKIASEIMISKMSELSLPATNLQLNSIRSLQRGLFRQKTPRKRSSATVVKDLDKQAVSPISRLIQIAHIKKYKEPEFTLVASSTNALPEDPQVLKTMSERDRRNIRKKRPSFTMEVTVGPHSSRGTGSNKKSAKKAAAETALIDLGYGPTLETKTDNTTNGANEQSGGKQVKSGENSRASKSKEAKDGTSKNKSSGVTGTAASKQIGVPGVILLNTDAKDSGSPVKHSTLVQEVAKVNALSPPPSNSGIQEGKEKLAYLAKLLTVSVSYSDFPKKNEFLSVVSFGTNPPHVAHGVGSTLEEAQNMAANKVMEELSDVGIDNVGSSGC